MSRWRAAFSQLKHYPSAVAGLAIIGALLALSLYTIITIPYGTAIERWGGTPLHQPVNAEPAWFNWFGADKPRTITVSSEDVADAIEVTQTAGDRRRVTIPLTFDFPYGKFPSEIGIFFESTFEERGPFAQLSWHTPDGRRFSLGARRLGKVDRIPISRDRALMRRMGGAPEELLFAEPSVTRSPEEQRRVQKGEYRLLVEVDLFEPDASVKATLINYGKVFGIAGTDHQRRDLATALMWGTPLALAFGLLAAVGTTITTLIIAAIGVWFGGLIDAAIQRITEVNMILPLLPILVMIGTLYSQSLWVMLGVVVLLGIFSAGIKMYRSMLLPVREAGYIEAARAYGAGNFRIVFRYMIPRILPVLIPSFVTLIPTYVFLEASLAVLGLGDPVLPTWGKVLNDALSQSALYNDHFYWVVAPALMLMLTGLGFAMLGFALDRIFNPRLRKI